MARYDQKSGIADAGGVGQVPSTLTCNDVLCYLHLQRQLANLRGFLFHSEGLSEVAGLPDLLTLENGC